MSKIIATIYNVTCNYSWQGENDTDTYTFGSCEGAMEWVESQNNLNWYAIEGFHLMPCDEMHPEGQLYQGMIFNEYHDLRKDRLSVQEIKEKIQDYCWNGNETCVGCPLKEIEDTRCYAPTGDQTPEVEEMMLRNHYKILVESGCIKEEE